MLRGVLTLRSAAVRAGLDYSEPSCVVRYLTDRYSPSDYIGETAVSNAQTTASNRDVAGVLTQWGHSV